MCGVKEKKTLQYIGYHIINMFLTIKIPNVNKCPVEFSYFHFNENFFFKCKRSKVKKKKLYCI